MADKKKKVRSVKDTPRHKVGVVLGTGFFRNTLCDNSISGLCRSFSIV